MNDMSRLAFQTDSTRVITLFLGGQRTPGVNFEDGRSIGGYHNLSHHGKDEVKLAELEEIEIAQMELFGEFLRGLQDVEETDGSLLDNTMVLYGCHMGDANIHNNINLPDHPRGRRFSTWPAPGLQPRHQHPASQSFCKHAEQYRYRTGAVRQQHGPATGIGYILMVPCSTIVL